MDDNPTEAGGNPTEQAVIGWITNIFTTISAMSDQTILLVLNASIEVARAGEHRKGFQL